MAMLTLFLFGAPRLERDGVVVKIPRRKALALLAYLAATGKSHARYTLAALFWPDHAQSEARLALSRHLSELNRLLATGMLILDAERVAVRDLWVDVNEFETLVAACPAATTAALPRLQAAVNLYAADFLAGFSLPDCAEFDDRQTFQSESLRRRLRAGTGKDRLGACRRA
jgi:DNA-binding SARP family transcriptional activator